jgi:hypothetical protein
MQITAEAAVVVVGLTAQEAQARLGQFGPNEPATTKRQSILSDLLHASSGPAPSIKCSAPVASCNPVAVDIDSIQVHARNSVKQRGFHLESEFKTKAPQGWVVASGA